MALVIGYDLDKPFQNYAAVEAYLKAQPGWWHALDSTWILVTSKSAVVVRDELWAVMGPSDKVFVYDTATNASAWVGFDPDSSAWLKKYL